VVIRLYPQVVVGNEDFAVADDGADGGAFRQVDFVKPLTHYPGGPVVAMGDGLNGLSSAPTE